MNDKNQKTVYVALCSKCGRVIAAAILDETEDEIQLMDEVMAWEAQGLRVEERVYTEDDPLPAWCQREAGCDLVDNKE